MPGGGWGGVLLLLFSLCTMKGGRRIYPTPLSAPLFVWAAPFLCSSPHYCLVFATFPPPSTCLPPLSPPPNCLTPFSFSFVSHHFLFFYIYPPALLHHFLHTFSAPSNQETCSSVIGINPQGTRPHRKLTASTITYIVPRSTLFPKSAHNRKCPCYLYRQ